jgi:amidase
VVAHEHARPPREQDRRDRRGRDGNRPEGYVGRPATELAAAVRDRRVSAVTLTRAHLDQLAAVEHRLGAFVSVRRRAALADAEAVDAHPDRAGLPLAGVPVAIKDVVDIAGEPTRHGSRATSPLPATEDEPVVGRLRAAGAVVIGKTRCPELSIWGTSEHDEGTAVSPWDPSRSAGGSSGGSGAAVAAGVVPLALASDGLGSVRIPAAANGCVGFKPGADLLPVHVEDEPHWFGMSRFGPIATTVRDAALLLDVMAGTDRHRDVARLTTSLRVAVSWKPPLPGTGVARPWVEAAIEAGRLLGHAGHEVRRADPPYEPATAAAITARWLQGAVRDVELLDLDHEHLQARTRGHVAAGERIATTMPVHGSQAERWRRRVLPFLEEHDVLVIPTFARVQPAAHPWHRRPWLANMMANLSSYPFTSPWNLADVPAAAVPVWQDRGRPLSVQVIAGPGREDLVLAVAAQLETLAPRTRHAPGWGVPA